MPDRLRSAIVGPDYPLASLGHLVKQGGDVVEVNTDPISLVVDVELVVADETAHEDGRVL